MRFILVEVSGSDSCSFLYVRNYTSLLRRIGTLLNTQPFAGTAEDRVLTDWSYTRDLGAAEQERLFLPFARFFPL